MKFRLKAKRRAEEFAYGPIAQLTPLVIAVIGCLTVLMFVGICCCGFYCFLGRAETIGRLTRPFRSKSSLRSKTEIEKLEMGKKDRNCEEIVSLQEEIPFAGTGGS